MMRPSVPWVVLFAVLLHLVVGVLLVGDASAGNATATHSLLDLYDSPKLVGMALILAALLALVGILRPSSRLTLLLLLPQQFALIVSAGGAVNAMWLSQFADGVMRPRPFIIADQSPVALMAILHTLAIIDLHGGLRWLILPSRSRR